jgi:hypothetical protein
MSRLMRFGVAIAGLLGLGAGGPAGCQKQFPERFGWYANDQGLYSIAFVAAVEEAVIRQRTGLSYFDHMGENARFLPDILDAELDDLALCNNKTLENYFGNKAVRCSILRRPKYSDCQNSSGCAILRYNPVIFQEETLRQTIVSAISNPCEFLTNPDSLEKPDVSANYGLTPWEAWRIMRCDTSKVVGFDPVFDDDNGILTLRFKEGV